MRNPFRYGDPIRTLDHFVGRKREIGLILSWIDSGADTSVVGDLRIGKTSLLNILSLLLREKPSVCLVDVNLQLLSSQDTPQSFWSLCLQRLCRELPCSELLTKLGSIMHTSPIRLHELGDFFEQVAASGSTVVFLLRELDHLLGLSQFDKDFFHHLRAVLSQSRGLVCVVSSRLPLHELERQHHKGITGSPFYNIFRVVTLGSFNPEEVDEFFELYMTNSPVRFRESERDFILDLAGGHPYYLQIAGSWMFAAYQRGLRYEDRLTYVRRYFAALAEATIADTWTLSSDNEKIVLTVLVLLSMQGKNTKIARKFNRAKLDQYYSHASWGLEGLGERGLLIEEDNEYAVFSSFFAEWILGELRSAAAVPQTYEAWVNTPSNQSLASRLKGDWGSEIREKILPQLKDAYWKLAINWLTDPATGHAALDLLKSWLR